MLTAHSTNGGQQPQILNNSEISKKLMGELVPIIYKALKVTA
jgi:hypothetical protein